MVCLPQLAKMNSDNLQKIKNLEKDLGVILVAYQPMEYADLTPDQVKELQKVEKNIGAMVVAYR